MTDPASTGPNADLIAELLETVAELAADGTDRLDLKITASSMGELRDAYLMFAPYKDRPKATIFGSARTPSDDPAYLQTHEVAAALAAAGWMVVTGAGPGIMQAAVEGAGAEQSIGISIQLPFEKRANDVIHNDPKHISMKYFFTRKLMLVKESKGFIAMPGGFGTLDEILELLTLEQTGKAEPCPIVLLDPPGGQFWPHFAAFVTSQVETRGLVSPGDLDRVLVTDSAEAAVQELVGFWRNYHSLRWVGDQLVIRLQHTPTETDVAALNEQFGRHLERGTIAITQPLGPEVKSGDDLDRPRLVMRWRQAHVGELFRLIRALNRLESCTSA